MNELEVFGDAAIPIDAMVIANHRAKNLGDILSYRDISKRDGGLFFKCWREASEET